MKKLHVSFCDYQNVFFPPKKLLKFSHFPNIIFSYKSSLSIIKFLRNRKSDSHQLTRELMMIPRRAKTFFFNFFKKEEVEVDYTVTGPAGRDVLGGVESGGANGVKVTAREGCQWHRYWTVTGRAIPCGSPVFSYVFKSTPNVTNMLLRPLHF